MNLKINKLITIKKCMSTYIYRQNSWTSCNTLPRWICNETVFNSMYSWMAQKYSYLGFGFCCKLPLGKRHIVIPGLLSTRQADLAESERNYLKLKPGDLILKEISL